MAIRLNDNLSIQAPKLIDDRSGPHDNLGVALAFIIPTLREMGLIFYVKDGIGGLLEYWWPTTDLTDGGIALRSYQPLDADLTAIANILDASTGFLKKTAANTWSLDTSVLNSSSVAGGDLEGYYPNPTVKNIAVINKVLTGFNTIGGGTIVDGDSILVAFGKVQNQLNALYGGMQFIDFWNASTNSPSIPTAALANKGHYYIVQTAGTTNIGGITDWKIGDWLVSNGSIWSKIDNTDAVVSVNGYTGSVILTTSDIAEGSNLYYTNVRVKAYADTLYSVLGHTHTFASLTSKPDTIGGYGITDAYLKSEINNFFSGTVGITGYNKINWDLAFGWGNHALAGYLKGTGVAQRVPYFSATDTVTSTARFVWNTTYNALVVNDGITGTVGATLSGAFDGGSLQVWNGHELAVMGSNVGNSGDIATMVMKSNKGNSVAHGYIDIQGYYAGGTNTAPLLFQRLGGVVLIGNITTGTDTINLLQVAGSIRQTSVTSALLKASATGVLQAAIAGTDYVTPGVLTGYVDLTTNQTIAGNKIFTGVTEVNSLEFNAISAPAHRDGLLFRDAATDFLTYYNEEAEIAQQIGQEIYVPVRNNSGATIANGAVVYISGSTGQRPNIALARADSLATSRVAGVATHAIENNSNGYITVIGVVNGLNTSAFTSGDELFLSATVAGAMTNVKPTGVNFAVVIGSVLVSNPSIGNIAVSLRPTADSAQRSIAQTITGAYTFTQPVTANSFVRSGGLSTQYLKADGSVSTLTNPITGTGTNTQLAYFNGVGSLTSDVRATFDGISHSFQNLIAGGTASLPFATSAAIGGGTATNTGFVVLNTTNILKFRTAAEVLSDIGAAAESGSANYIQNGTSQQASSNYNISGSGTIGGNLIVTGTSRLNGSIGLGTAPSSAIYMLIEAGVPTGTTTRGINVGGTISPTSTVGYQGFYFAPVTANTAITYSQVTAFQLNASGLAGAASTVSTLNGFHYAGSTASSNITNVYVFRSNLLAGANRWNLYMDGTASNHFQGTTLIGTTTDNGVDKLQVSGSGSFVNNLSLNGSSNSALFQLNRSAVGNASAIGFRTSGTQDWYVGTNILGGSTTHLDFYSYGGNGMAMQLNYTSSDVEIKRNLLNAASTYHNFGTTSGTSGYGFRDNAGSMEFKNSGGSWNGFVGGTGTANQIAYWNGTSTQTGSSNFTIDLGQFSLALGGTPTSFGSGYSTLLLKGTALNRGGAVYIQSSLGTDIGFLTGSLDAATPVGMSLISTAGNDIFLRAGGTGNNSLQAKANRVIINNGIDDGVNNLQVSGSLIATSLKRTGGTSSQFLKADGSVDASTYLTSTTGDVRYLQLTGGTVSGAIYGTSIDASAFNSNGGSFFSYTLKGRASDNYGAFGFYSNNGATRYGYFQSHSSNGGQLLLMGDGGGSIVLDSRGVVLNNHTIGSTLTLSGALSGTTLAMSGEGLFGGSTGLTGIGGGISVSNSSSAGVQFKIGNISKGWIYATNGNKLTLDGTTGVGIDMYTNGFYTIPAFSLSTIGEASFLSTGTFASRTRIGGGYIADIAGTGNNIGVFFAASSIISTDGSGSYSAKDFGNSSNRWRDIYAHSINAAGVSQTAAQLNGGFYGNSGGDYHTIGYNVGFTTTSGTWNYVFADFASFIRFSSGGFEFWGAPASSGIMSPTKKFDIYNNGNALLAGTMNATNFVGNLNGYGTSVSSNGNTYVLRDSSGYTYASYFNQSSGNSEPGTISQFIITNGTDNFFRKVSVSQVHTALGLNTGSSLTNNITGTAAGETLSTVTSRGNATTGTIYVNGSNADWALRVIASAATNASYGIYNRAGTNSLDWNYYFTNQNGNILLGSLNGAGDFYTLGKATIGGNILASYDVTSSAGQGRFGGWYNGGGYIGAAVEVGMSSGQGNVIAYNRNTGTYSTINVAGVNINLQAQGGNISFNSNMIATNYGLGLVGLYSSTVYQNVFSMGTDYTVAAGGGSLNNHYGIAWTHSNTGGQSIAGLGHQALFTAAGLTQTAIGDGIWTRASILALGNVRVRGGYIYGQSDNSFIRLDNGIGSQIGYSTFADTRYDSTGFSVFVNSVISQRNNYSTGRVTMYRGLDALGTTGSPTDSLSWNSNTSGAVTGFHYSDSAGVGITNAATYTNGSMVYLVNGITYFYSGATVISNIHNAGFSMGTNRGISDGLYHRITNPGNGSYVTNASSVTGAIKIKLPYNLSSVMTTFTVKVYEYTAGKSFTITVGGHPSGNVWYNTSCYLDGDVQRSALTVRFGQDGGQDCVWIGETSSVWSYPQVFITDAQFGYASYGQAWMKDWVITFETAFGTINTTRTAQQKVVNDGNLWNINCVNSNYSSQVAINYNNDSNSTYQMLWGSGNSVYGTAGISCNPATDQIFAAALALGGRGTSYSFSTPDWRIYNTAGNLLSFNNYTSDLVTISQTGALTATGGGFNSDINDKHLLDYTLDSNILDLHSLFYTRKSTNKKEYGYIAQEVQKYLPEAVYDTGSNGLAVSYHMVNAARIEAVVSEVDILKREVAQLKEQVKQLGG